MLWLIKPWPWFVSSIYATDQQSTTQSLLNFLKIDSWAEIWKDACLQCYTNKTSRWHPRWTNKMRFDQFDCTGYGYDLDWVGSFKQTNIWSNETRLIDFYGIDYITIWLRDTFQIAWQRFNALHKRLKCIDLFLLKPILIKHNF